MTGPRILVIDDELGRSPEAQLDFATTVGLSDMDERLASSKSLASVRFVSGQVRKGEIVENRMDRVLSEIAAGWPFDDGGRWSLVILDLHFVSGRLQTGHQLPEGAPGDEEFGARILRELSIRWPGTSISGTSEVTSVPVIVFSGREREKAEEECNRLGALDYVSRHATFVERRSQIARALFLHGLVEDGALRLLDSTGNVIQVRRGDRIIGRSLEVLQALRLARRVGASPDAKPCVRGETGTGKELLARYLHDVAFHPAVAALMDGRKTTSSKDAERAFVPGDLSNRPGTMMESYIFGAEAGAFTGAPTRGMVGLIERANGGTLFLDEIGNLEFGLAEKLLRLMNNGEYERLGGQSTRTATCRFVVATDKPLEKLVEQGEYPAPLVARFTTPHIWLPPLRDRGTDVQLLFTGLLEAAVKKQGGTWPKTITPEVYEFLAGRGWDQNIRTLKGLVQWVATLRASATRIDISDMLPIEGGARGQLEEGLDHGAEPAFATGDSVGLTQPLSGAATYKKMWGVLPRLVGDSVARAAEANRDQKTGKVNRTRTVECLMGVEMSPTDARRTMRKLAKTFSLSESPDEGVRELLAWALGAGPKQEL